MTSAPPPEIAPRRTRRRRAVVALLIAGAVVLAVGAANFDLFLIRMSPAWAEAGECARGGGDGSGDYFRTVDCDDDRAVWRIVGRVDTVVDSPMEVACKDFPTTTSAIWETRIGGYVLCLEPLKK